MGAAAAAVAAAAVAAAATAAVAAAASAAAAAAAAASAVAAVAAVAALAVGAQVQLHYFASRTLGLLFFGGEAVRVSRGGSAEVNAVRHIYSCDSHGCQRLCA